MKCIGIDIGSFSVKVSIVETQGKELHLLDFLEFELATGPTSDNRVLIVDILRQISEKYDPAIHRYTFCLPQSQVSSRQKIFPFKERSKVLKTIPFELEDDIPFDLEESVFDAKFVRFLGSSSEVIASATPKKNVLAILELASSVGIDPDIVSSQGVAIANLVEDFNSVAPTETATAINEDSEDEGQTLPPAQAHALVSIGHSSTLVSIYRNFRLVSLRTIDWGGADISAAIAKRYRIPIEEALKELQSKAFVLTSPEGASKDQILFSDTIAGSFTPFLRDLKLFLLDAQNEFELKIGHISTTGGTSQVRNLAAFMTQKLGFATDTFDIFDRFPITHMELTPQVRSSSGIALALAIEGIKRPVNPATNFRKNDLEKQSQTLLLFWSEWGHAVRMAMIATLLLYCYAFTKSFLAEQALTESAGTLKRQARKMGLRGSQARPRGIKKYLKQQKSQVKNRAALKEMTTVNSALDLLSELSRTIPAKRKLTLDLKKFNIENERLTLTGSVAEIGQLKILELALKGISKNGKVTKTRPPTPPGSGKVGFQYDLLVSRNFPKMVSRKSRGKK